MSSPPPASASASERRRFRRIDFEAVAKLFSPSRAWRTELIDISLHGVLLVRPTDWYGSAGEKYRVALILEGSTSISMGVTVAHVRPDSVGFEIDRIDFESFANLKRLIELNLGDPKALNRELSVLGE